MVLNDVNVVNATLSGMEPFTWYDVRVAAFTNGGTGESPGVEVRTLESGKKRRLSCLLNTDVLFSFCDKLFASF